MVPDGAILFSHYLLVRLIAPLTSITHYKSKDPRQMFFDKKSKTKVDCQIVGRLKV